MSEPKPTDEQRDLAERMLDCYPQIGEAAGLLAERDASLLAKLGEVARDLERELAQAEDGKALHLAGAVALGKLRALLPATTDEANRRAPRK